ncbi:enoyl-CoA hydratase/isomerase family protein [Mesorhizobium sp. J428]|uniref:enoyl-CoA hydratase/isomerase family protein n=1 Tax=Mesorhizobium sp. J428 TaxID=2898440 RepID=UPI002150DD26|nr:enoyl-CoA hydratase-related protein [Mesorhizobium sp. J428]MCR5859699.1 enoyl-CoA hydratase-related protein [Mesorhizobium sp. J428]
MNYDRYEAIEVGREGRKLTLTLSNPAALNAVTARMHAELSTIFIDAGQDDETDVVVLTGAGTAFCAGGDINWMQTLLDAPGGMAGIGIEGRRIIHSLLDLDKPVICRMNGDAIGLGATLALFCDVVIADRNARIGDPHVRVGLVAGDGGAVIWPQLVGYSRAKQFLMTGDLIGAERAEAIGLVNIVVPADKLDEEVARFADKLLRGAQHAIRWTKMSVNIGLRQLADSVLDASLGYEVASSMLPDHREAVAAFREGRRPAFDRR